MQLCAEIGCLLVQWQLLALSAVVAALVALAFSFIRPRKGSTYLIDFYCLRPPNRCSTVAIHPHPYTLFCMAPVEASWLWQHLRVQASLPECSDCRQPSRVLCDVSVYHAAALQRCEPLLSALPQRSACLKFGIEFMCLVELEGESMCLASCRLQSRLEDMKIGYRLPENNYSQQAIDFMDKVLDISGLGDATFLSDGLPASCSTPVQPRTHACYVQGQRTCTPGVALSARCMQAAVRPLGLRLPVCPENNGRLCSCLLAMLQSLKCPCVALRRCGAGP